MSVCVARAASLMPRWKTSGGGRGGGGGSPGRLCKEAAGGGQSVICAAGGRLITVGESLCLCNTVTASLKLLHHQNTNLDVMPPVIITVFGYRRGPRSDQDSNIFNI